VTLSFAEWVSGYLAALALVLIQRVQALTLFPSKTAYCKFGNSLRMEALILWERFMVRE
jgi:hypothetical protein